MCKGGERYPRPLIISREDPFSISIRKYPNTERTTRVQVYEDIGRQDGKIR